MPSSYIFRLMDKVLSGYQLAGEEALEIAKAEGAGLFDLFTCANRLREAFRGKAIDLCSIINAKSGSCTEDCAYCAQSAKAKAEINKYPLMSKEEVVRAAKEAKASGARRFCIVTSGKRPGSEEIKKIADMVGDVRKTGLLPCATLGLLGENELEFLKDSGLERYHNNSETSRRFYPEICSTHSYDEKMRTVEAVRKVGLSLCSGGIFGMGETWEDRVDMAFALKETGADSIPINFLNPIMGTRLEGRSKLPPLEALRTISLYRFILPDREIRVCGGRLQTLGEFNSLVFMAGADGLLTGNYLTTSGRDPDSDLALIREYGLRPA